MADLLPEHFSDPNFDLYRPLLTQCGSGTSEGRLRWLRCHLKYGGMKPVCLLKLSR